MYSVMNSFCSMPFGLTKDSSQKVILYFLKSLLDTDESDTFSMNAVGLSKYLFLNFS